jgi:hypothetical protein
MRTLFSKYPKAFQKCVNDVTVIGNYVTFYFFKEHTFI